MTPCSIGADEAAAVRLAGIVKALVRRYGRDDVEEAVEAELRQRLGAKDHGTFRRHRRAKELIAELMLGDPNVTLWRAVMLVCDEEAILDADERKAIFYQVYQLGRRRARRVKALTGAGSVAVIDLDHPEAGVISAEAWERDLAIEEEAARWAALIVAEEREPDPS